jgi:4-hydroxybenzoate polyprenyltransferase
MLVGIVATALFFLGGSEGSLEVAGDFLDIPKFTNVLLYWIYALVVLVILATFGFVLAKLVETFKVDPKRGLTSVLVVLGAATSSCSARGWRRPPSASRSRPRSPTRP